MSRAHLSKATGACVLTILAVSCARDPLDEVAWQASRHGTATTRTTRDQTTAPLDAAARITERYYWIAKYQATMEQRRIAEDTARRFETRVQANARTPKQRAPRYLAVRTRSDARAKSKTSVMIWDTQSQKIVGNEVYDLNEGPRAEAQVKFETFSARYVGGG
jgi:Tfp pilus assembly protein PilE